VPVGHVRRIHGGHANARQTVLARSAIASHPQPTPDESRNDHPMPGIARPSVPAPQAVAEVVARAVTSSAGARGVG
jgi:hypothetical protein